jgi:hypothetical protein
MTTLDSAIMNIEVPSIARALIVVTARAAGP